MMMMRKILLAALAIAGVGVSSTILPDRAVALAGETASIWATASFYNGVSAANGPASNGTYHDGLSLEGVILPELAE